MRFLAICLFCLIHLTSLAQIEWQVKNYNINFSIKNMGFNVNGKFEGLEATIIFDENDLGKSNIEASVASSTIDTDIGMRDNHLCKPVYFDVGHYPTIKMTSTRFEQTENGFVGYFELTIKGITKSIEMPFTFKQHDNQATFTGSFTINRRDFNVGKNSLTMGDDVVVDLAIKVVDTALSMK